MNPLRISCLMFLLLGAAATVFAQDKATIAPLAQSKFTSMEGIPACLTLSVQRGDPTKGAAVLLLKMTSGCVVPWHWHTANESLMFVKGAGKLEMKDEAAHALVVGDYVFLPAKHNHQFTCTTACTFFNETDGAFDIHYVDKDGKEISPADALKSGKKPSATKAGKKK